jgi:hypothetical protein
VNFHESVAAELAGDPTVAGLISNRIFPLLIPQQSLQDETRHGCIVYTRIGVDRTVNLCGTSRLVDSSLQIDCYAQRFGPALAIAKAAREALIDFSGELGGSGGIIVKQISLDREIEFTDPDPGLYRISQAYTVWHLQD